GPCRNVEVDGPGLGHLERLAHEAAHHLELAADPGELRHRAHEHRRVMAEHERYLHGLLQLAVRAKNVRGVVRGVGHEPKLRRPLKLVAEDACIETAALGVATDGRRGGGVPPGLELLVYEAGESGAV